MTSASITDLRLQQQQLTKTKFKQPAELVRWCGAVQAQDYPGALWALGLRLPAATEAVIEQALADRAIIRTWPMRGTLHFVTAEDARWLLQLLAARVVKANAQRYVREFGLDAATLAQAAKVISKALAGQAPQTRQALYAILEQAGIVTGQQRGLHILTWLAQNGLICGGPRAGKQPTFVLLDEWLPPTKALTPEEALYSVASRYFTSHGPATLQDFIWWTGLTKTEAQHALELAKSQLLQETLAAQTYWFAATKAITKRTAPLVKLLPAYDEYTVGYKDRSAFLDPSFAKQTGNGIFSPVIVLDGQIVGSWKRTRQREKIALSITKLRQFDEAENQALAKAAQQYGKFQQAAVVLA